MINSLMSRMGAAEKLTVAQLQQAVKDGTLPAYVGIPLIQDKMKQQQEAQAGKPVPPQPPVAEQVLMAADQRRGIDEASSNLPEMSAAEGGIMSYAAGGDVDAEDYEDYLQQAQDEQDLEFANMAAENQGIAAVAKEPAYVNKTPNVEQGIKQAPVQSTAGSVNQDQARKYNVGNLRPSGFTYPGQIGLSKGKFALFDSPEAGLNALNHDIDVKLNRGLNTPEKFLNVYAPKSDKNDTEAYIRNVSKALGIKPNQEIPNTPEAKQVLANAIIKQEGAMYATANFADGGIASIPSYAGNSKTFGSLVQDVPEAGEGNEMLANYLANLDYSKPDYSQMIAQENARLLGRTPNTGFSPTSALGITQVPQAALGSQLLSGYTPEPVPAAPTEVAAPRVLPRSQARAFEGIKELMTPAPSQRTLAARRAYTDSATPAATLASQPTEVAPMDTSERDRERARSAATAGVNQRDIAAGNLQSSPNVIDMLNSKFTSDQFQVPTAAAKAPKEESMWDKYLAGLNMSREDLKAQKEEDKYLAILAAGLGTLKAAGTIEPGKVHTTLGDVSTGGLEGLGYAANAAKSRAAQEIALNKEIGTGLYRQELIKSTGGNRNAQLDINRAALEEKKREFAGKQLEGKDKQIRDQVLAYYKLDPTKALSDPDVAASIERQIALAKQKDPTYNVLHKNYYGFDYATPVASGDNVMRFDKTGKQV